MGLGKQLEFEFMKELREKDGWYLDQIEYAEPIDPKKVDAAFEFMRKNLQDAYEKNMKNLSNCSGRDDVPLTSYVS